MPERARAGTNVHAAGRAARSGRPAQAARRMQHHVLMPRSHAKGSNPRWVRGVKTVSTFPPAGLFTRNAETIARVMATKRVSPKGIGSGIRMIQFFINRGGRNLPARQRRELERAKRLLQARRAKQEKRA